MKYFVQLDQWVQQLGSKLGHRSVSDALRMLSHYPDLPPISQEMVRAQAAYLDAGEQTFVVGPRMRGMLEMTSLKGVKSSDIKLPYPAIWVATPESGQKLWDGSEWHPLEGFYAVYLPPGVEIRYLDGRRLDPQATLTLVMWGEKKGADAGDDAMSSLVFPLDEADGRLEEYITEVMDKGTYRIESEIVALDEADRDGVTRASQMCLRVLVNLCMYLSCEGAVYEEALESQQRRAEKARLAKRAKAAKKPSKREKAKKAADRIPTSTVVMVAPHIEGNGDGTGTHASPHAHWVRGHWHHYRHGKGRALVKLRWVQPYPKGEKPGPRPAHVYDVRPPS